MLEVGDLDMNKNYEETKVKSFLRVIA